MASPRSNPRWLPAASDSWRTRRTKSGLSANQRTAAVSTRSTWVQPLLLRVHEGVVDRLVDPLAPVDEGPLEDGLVDGLLGDEVVQHAGAAYAHAGRDVVE